MPAENATELRLLGALEVIVGGRSVVLPASKKTRALLGYLVVTGSPQLRGHLCDLLWQGPDDPRGALRWSLTKLRSAVGERHLVADRESVGFQPAGASCDATDVRAALSGGVSAAPTPLLEEVSARFRGELLEGLDLPDCYRYHEWCAGEREGLRRLRVEVLAELMQRAGDDPAKALAYARQRLAIDPITESAHVAVVQLLTTLGRNAEAAHQVDACRRILSTELGVAPSQALTAARVRASASRTPAPAVPVAEPARTAHADGGAVAFVGRDTETDTIHRAWGATLTGGGSRVVLLTGESGIGKSRIVAETAAQAAIRGARVLRGRAFEAEMVRPYGPWIDALPDLGLAEAEPMDRTRAFDGVVALLRALSEPTGCFVAFDDLQWFDEASLALLHFASRALGTTRVLFTCTARGDELLESTAAIRCVRAMQREGRLEEIEIGPLDERATRRLAASVDAGIDADPIAAESGGHPFFAVELARARVRGVQTSDSLDALLADRLDRLDAGAGALVPWAAALGRSFRADVLARVTGVSDVELVAALSELERRGILRADTSGARPAYDFVHDLVRTAAYRRLSAPRRSVLHRAIARVLEGLATGDEALFGDVTHHAALAGEHEIAARAAVAASERCIRMFATEEAARIAESGLVHTTRFAGHASLRARIALLGVKTLSGLWLRRASELAEELSAATEEARTAGLHAESLRGLYYLSLLHREHGDLEGAHRSTREAVSLCRNTDDTSRGRQLVLSARCFTLIERDVENVRGMLDEAATLLPDHEQDFEWCWAVALESDYRDTSDAGELLERAYALAHREQQPWNICECLMRLAQRAFERGEPARALDWCKELGPVVAKLTDGSEGVVAEALLALGAAASGAAGADDRLERALARLRDVDAKGMLAYVLAALAEIDRRAGRVERAQAHAEEALVLARRVDRRTLVAWARASLAEIAMDRADAKAARRHLAAVAGDLKQPLRISGRARARVERASARIG